MEKAGGIGIAAIHLIPVSVVPAAFDPAGNERRFARAGRARHPDQWCCPGRIELPEQAPARIAPWQSRCDELIDMGLRFQWYPSLALPIFESKTQVQVVTKGVKNSNVSLPGKLLNNTRFEHSDGLQKKVSPPFLPIKIGIITQ